MQKGYSCQDRHACPSVSAAAAFPASATGPPKAPESHTIPDSETWFPQYPSAPGTVLMIRSCKVQRMGKKVSCSAEIFNNLFGEK